MSDIKIEIKTEKSQDGMSQGAYVLFGKYTINIIRTPGDNKFTNLEQIKVLKRIRDLNFINGKLYLFLERPSSIGVISFN